VVYNHIPEHWADDWNWCLPNTQVFSMHPTRFFRFNVLGTCLQWLSTAATILKGVGSVGLSLVFWTLGLVIAGSQLAVYVELASYFPNRSGAEVVYLEQAYPRPKYLLPTAFAVQSVLLSFSSSNAIGTYALFLSQIVKY
jgi:amino acid transporter